jgi:hypothetical protein
LKNVANPSSDRLCESLYLYDTERLRQHATCAVWFTYAFIAGSVTGDRDGGMEGPQYLPVILGESKDL